MNLSTINLALRQWGRSILPIVLGDKLLMQDGSLLLLESGDAILLEAT